ncbi:FAD-binding domain-containing protein [Erythrobacter sp. Alg231-14]|uniref:FAD-binding domain-containing protein n=1 Tax=Erythrobacter sp. Alg231-14 TaxID=1922225 RepID=UPI00307C1057
MPADRIGTAGALCGCTDMEFEPTRAAGLKRLTQFIPSAGDAYANTRNFDDGVPQSGARSNVSQLSPWLHAGLISETEVIEAVLAEHSLETADKFIAEVFWRVYFKGYFEQRPTVWPAYITGRDAAIAALDDNADMAASYTRAINGRTGIQAFDHWARELVSTGYLHNHARMWFASIWIFTLRLDWQLGADFFLQHLIDGDAASNTLSWRWVGGLHTKGKTYLARADNIARFTANQPRGPLRADGLVSEAPALEEADEHARAEIDMPAPALGEASTMALDEPYALILHDEAASHSPLNLSRPPALIVGAARPDARAKARHGIGAAVRTFANGSVNNGAADAAAEYGCAHRMWQSGESLTDIVRQHGINRVALPYIPVGWTRDALWPDITPFAAKGDLITLLSEIDRATWPLAKAGFFGVKKKIGNVLTDIGVHGGQFAA